MYNIESGAQDLELEFVAYEPAALKMCPAASVSVMGQAHEEHLAGARRAVSEREYALELARRQLQEEQAEVARLKSRFAAQHFGSCAPSFPQLVPRLLTRVARLVLPPRNSRG